LRIVGLDLAGSETRRTGFCSMDQSLSCRTKVLYTDEEVVRETMSESPDVVSIDAPLFLPKGRESLDVRGPPHLRACDRELLRMKIRFFPISVGPMRMLTKRGMSLRGVFEGSGLRVIESFPGAIQDILGMPRKQEGLERLRAAIIRYGASGEVDRSDLTGDELDAITCALVGKLLLEGDYLAIGDPEEGLMILPKRTSHASVG
jgi:predicted nuclease with RNAse H fold